MRLTFRQFQLLILASLAFATLCAFLQIVCFSRSLQNRPCADSYYQLPPGFHANSNLSPHQLKQLPTVYLITPTYARPTQKAELTRLSYTFLLVPNLHWILVEDYIKKTDLVTNFITHLEQLAKTVNSGLNITHLNVPTPKEYKTRLHDPNWLKPRGVLQRNAGLTWLRENYRHLDKHGVVYFADDDNTYDLRLFEEMRSTIKVSVWPVGLVGGLMVEKPYVEYGQIKAWNTQWKPERPYPVDMAGFAVSLKLIYERPEATFSYRIPRGFQESHLLSLLIEGPDELEPKADNCSKVFVWHTRTENAKLNQELRLKVPSNHGIEL